MPNQTALGPDSLLARSLRYHLLRGKMDQGDLARADLYNRTYLFWKEFWTAVYRQNGTDHTPQPDDLLRQDWVGVFEHRDKPVALHAHSLFDTRQLAAREHSYFSRYFTDRFFEALRQRGAHRLLSVECYSVAPEWRSERLGVSIAAVMVGLGLKLADSMGADAAVAVARVDLGVDQMARNQGAVTVETGLHAHNTPVELVAFYPDRVHPHADPRVSSLVDYFWRHRTGAGTETFPETERIAA